MKNILLLTLFIASLFILPGCTPPAKTFSIKAYIKVQPSADARTVSNVAGVIKKRLLTYGLKERAIASSISGNTISLSLSGVTDSARVKQLLTAPGNLEFSETFENSEVLSYLGKADGYLMSHPEDVINEQAPAQESGESELADKIESESLKPDSLLSVEEWNNRHPLFGRLKPNVGSDGNALPGSVVGYALIKDTAVVGKYLKMKDIRAFMPADLKFAWSKDPARNSASDPLFELHAIKMTTRDGKAPLNGNAITTATVKSGRKYALPVVQISMNSEGAAVWSRMTSDNVGRCIAIIIDGRVVSSPRVMSEITGGNSEISAGFSVTEASDLANIINSGSLPAVVILENK